MRIWRQFINNVKLRRIVVLLILITILYLFRSMMTTILLTFILTLLVTKLVHLMQKWFKIPSAIIVIAIYVVVLALISLALTTYLPRIANGMVNIYEFIINFYNSANSPSSDLSKTLGISVGMQDWLVKAAAKFNFVSGLKTTLNSGLSYITEVGSTSFSIFLSVMLSFFFTLEEKHMAQFSKKFLNSNISWFFQDVYYFAKIFVKTFGVVLEAQFFIAICNTVITTIVMAFMGLPQLFVLSIVVFVLSLIPVAGVIISFIPLSIVGFSVGGIKDVIYMIIMILVVHMFEAYVLNPKFMSSRTKLPIFYTFVVLLVGEEIFGGWGLIVSVPIFTFLLDLLGVQKVGKDPTVLNPKDIKDVKQLKNKAK